MNTTYLLTAMATMTITSHAASISVNFTESEAGHANQHLAAATLAGLDSQPNWNDAPGANGSLTVLNDSTGAASGASVTWSSGGVWGDGSADTDANAGVGNAQVARGYLDDGGAGADWTVTGIPYSEYTAIIYYSTDTNEGLYRPSSVNGSPYSTSGIKNQYGTEPDWNSTNSIIVTGLTGDLVVDNDARDGANRASIAGFQIVEGTFVIPEPTGSALFGLAGLALLFRRRK